MIVIFKNPLYKDDYRETGCCVVDGQCPMSSKDNIGIITEHAVCISLVHTLQSVDVQFTSAKTIKPKKTRAEHEWLGC